MDFSPAEQRGRFNAPNANYTDPLRVHADHSGGIALAKESGKTGLTFWGGALAYKEQVDSAKSLEANNEYNRLMSEGTAELMQRKQEKALNIVEDYDKLQAKVLEQIQKKYKNYIGYGKAAVEFNNYTTKDNATRRANMLKYQLAETDAFQETQYQNQMQTCMDIVASGGYSDRAIAEGMNRARPLIEQKWANYGNEKTSQQMRLVENDMVENALSFFTSTGDYARMKDICIKYKDVIDPKKMASVLALVNKRQKEAQELSFHQKMWNDLGPNATPSQIDAYVEKHSSYVKRQSGGAGGLMSISNDVRADSGVTAATLNKLFEGGVLEGMGQDFIEIGHKYNIDPAFLAAITKAENSYGHDLSGKLGNEPGYENNVMSNESGRTFSSKRENIEDMAQEIVADDGFYFGQGNYTIDDIGAVYAPAGADNDIRGENAGWGGIVKSAYEDMAEIQSDFRGNVESANDSFDSLKLEEEKKKARADYAHRQSLYRGANNSFIEQGGNALQDLFNHDVMDEEQYNAVVDNWVAQSGFNNDVRIALETKKNKLVKSIQRAQEAETRRQEISRRQQEKRQPSAKVTEENKDYVRRMLSAGKWTVNDIEDYCNHLGITSQEERNKLIKMDKEHMEGKGDWAIPYDLIRKRSGVDPRHYGKEAEYNSELDQIARMEYQIMLSENGGRLQDGWEYDLAKRVADDTTKYYVGGSYTKKGWLFDSEENRTVPIRDIVAAGYRPIVEPTGDDGYILWKANGEAVYMTGEELSALAGTSDYIE